MAYLYQDIMGVPGLSGSAYNRQKQLYEKMGSPMGAYRGTYDQNIWLLNQIKSGAAQKAMQPAATSSGGSSGGSTTTVTTPVTPVLEEILPPKPTQNPSFFPSLTEQWDLMQPAAMNAAAQAVDPELQRGYNKNYGNLTRQLASSGAGSFGRGLGQIGSLQAETARQRAAQLYDVVNQYRAGFENLYYNPTWESWKNSLTNYGTADTPKMPSWDEFYANYGGQLGPGTTPDTSYKVGLNFNTLPGYQTQPVNPAPIGTTGGVMKMPLIKDNMISVGGGGTTAVGNTGMSFTPPPDKMYTQDMPPAGYRWGYYPDGRRVAVPVGEQQLPSSGGVSGAVSNGGFPWTIDPITGRWKDVVDPNKMTAFNV